MPRASKSTKATAAEAKRRQRANEALDMRKMGMTYRDIAKEMHITVSTAYKYVTDALHEITRENAEDVLTLELSRYDELLAAHYSAALQGDPLATDKCLAILSRIERLSGVDGPTTKDGTMRVKSMIERLLEE